jgi:hypothetical protein
VMFTGLPEVPELLPADGDEEPHPAAAAARAAMAPTATMALRCRIRFGAAVRLSSFTLVSVPASASGPASAR